MSKFNRKAARTAARSPIVAASQPTGTTHEGRAGYERDKKGELFLLAVVNMVGEATFYEEAPARDTRYRALIGQVAVEDPEWTGELLRWLRGEANMRSASLVGAAEAVRARLAAGQYTGNRTMIDSVLQRADEPGEFLAYWTGRYGRKLPKAVKRGLSDAVWRLYNERNALKYDTASHAWRFADVIELVHPTGTLRDSRGRQPVAGTFRPHLYEYLLADRHSRPNIGEIVGEGETAALPTIRANMTLRAQTARDATALLDPTVLRNAGMTWEDALSLGPQVDKAKLWSAMIPSMGYMALLRNLRNFDDAGVPDEVAATVAARLANPDEVARSRQLPFRFYAAYLAVVSLRWAHALELALAASLANVPSLPGRTLILIDQSPSMFPGYSYHGAGGRTEMTLADKATLFGSALALRAEHATLVGYGHSSYEVQFRRGEAVLRLMTKFHMDSGTDVYSAAARHFRGHERIVVVTDGENNGPLRSYRDAGIPDRVPIYTWYLGGYPLAQEPGGPHRHTFAGLTDACFRLIPLLEHGRDAPWPWQAPAAVTAGHEADTR